MESADVSFTSAEGLDEARGYSSSLGAASDLPPDDDLEAVMEVIRFNPRSANKLVPVEDMQDAGQLATTRFFDVRSGEHQTVYVDLATRTGSFVNFGQARFHTKPPATLEDRVNKDDREAAFEIDRILRTPPPGQGLGLSQKTINEVSFWEILQAGVNSTTGDSDLCEYLSETIGKLAAVVAVADVINYPVLPSEGTEELAELRTRFEVMMRTRAASAEASALTQLLSWSSSGKDAADAYVYHTEAVYTDRQRQVWMMTYHELQEIQGILIQHGPNYMVNPATVHKVRTLFYEDVSGETPFRGAREPDAASGDYEWAQTDLGPVSIRFPNKNRALLDQVNADIEAIFQKLHEDIPTVAEIRVEEERVRIEADLASYVNYGPSELLELQARLRALESRAAILKAQRMDPSREIDEAMIALEDARSREGDFLFRLRLEYGEYIDAVETFEEAAEFVRSELEGYDNQAAQLDNDMLENRDDLLAWATEAVLIRDAKTEAIAEVERIQESGNSIRAVERAILGVELDALREKRAQLLDEGTERVVNTHAHSVEYATQRGVRDAVMEEAYPRRDGGMIGPTISLAGEDYVPANLRGADPVRNWGVTPVQGTRGYMGTRDPSLLQWDCCGQIGLDRPGCWVGSPDPHQELPYMTAFFNRRKFPGVKDYDDALIDDAAGFTRRWVDGLQLGDLYDPSGDGTAAISEHLARYKTLRTLHSHVARRMGELAEEFCIAGSTAELELDEPTLIKLKVMYSITASMNAGFGMDIAERHPSASAARSEWVWFIFDDIFGLNVTRRLHDLGDEEPFAMCAYEFTDTKFVFTPLQTATPLTRAALNVLGTQLSDFYAAWERETPDGDDGDDDAVATWRLTTEILRNIAQVVMPAFERAHASAVLIPRVHPESVAMPVNTERILQILQLGPPGAMDKAAVDLNLSDAYITIAGWREQYLRALQDSQRSAADLFASIAEWANEYIIDGVVCQLDALRDEGVEALEALNADLTSMSKELYDYATEIGGRYDVFAQELDQEAVDGRYLEQILAISTQAGVSVDPETVNNSQYRQSSDDEDDLDSTLILSSSTSSEIAEAREEDYSSEERTRPTAYTGEVTLASIATSGFLGETLFELGSSKASNAKIGARGRFDSTRGTIAARDARSSDARGPTRLGAARRVGQRKLPATQNPKSGGPVRPPRSKKKKVTMTQSPSTGRQIRERAKRDATQALNRNRKGARAVTTVADRPSGSGTPTRTAAAVETRGAKRGRIVHDKDTLVSRMLQQLQDACNAISTVAGDRDNRDLEGGKFSLGFIPDNMQSFTARSILPRYTNDEQSADILRYAKDTAARWGSFEFDALGGEALYGNDVGNLFSVMRIMINGGTIDGTQVEGLRAEKDKSSSVRYKIWRLVERQGIKLGVVSPIERGVVGSVVYSLDGADVYAARGNTLQLGYTGTVLTGTRKFKAYRVVQMARNIYAFTKVLQVLTRPSSVSGPSTYSEYQALFNAPDSVYAASGYPGDQFAADLEQYDADTAERRAKRKEDARVLSLRLKEARRYPELGPSAGEQPVSDQAGLNAIVPRLLPILTTVYADVERYYPVKADGADIREYVFASDSLFTQAVLASGLYSSNRQLASYARDGISILDGLAVCLRAISAIRGALASRQVYASVVTSLDALLARAKVVDDRSGSVASRAAPAVTPGKEVKLYDTIDSQRRGTARLAVAKTTSGSIRVIRGGVVAYAKLFKDTGALLAVAIGRDVREGGLDAAARTMFDDAQGYYDAYATAQNRVWEDAADKERTRVAREKASIAVKRAADALDLSAEPYRHYLAREHAAAQLVAYASDKLWRERATVTRMTLALKGVSVLLGAIERDIYPNMNAAQRSGIFKILQKMRVLDAVNGAWRKTIKLVTGRGATVADPVGLNHINIRRRGEAKRMISYAYILTGEVLAVTMYPTKSAWAELLTAKTPTVHNEVVSNSNSYVRGTPETATEVAFPRKRINGAAFGALAQHAQDHQREAELSYAQAQFQPTQVSFLGNIVASFVNVFRGAPRWPTQASATSAILLSLRKRIRERYFSAQKNGRWDYFLSSDRMSAIARILVAASDPTLMGGVFEYPDVAGLTSGRTMTRSKYRTPTYSVDAATYGKTAVAFLERAATLVGIRRPEWVTTDTGGDGTFAALARTAGALLLPTRKAAWISKVVVDISNVTQVDTDTQNWYVSSDADLDKLTIVGVSSLAQFISNLDLYIMVLLVLGNRYVGSTDGSIDSTLLPRPVEGQQNVMDVVPEVSSYADLIAYSKTVTNLSGLKIAPTPGETAGRKSLLVKGLDVTLYDLLARTGPIDSSRAASGNWFNRDEKRQPPSTTEATRARDRRQKELAATKQRADVSKRRARFEASAPPLSAVDGKKEEVPLEDTDDDSDPASPEPPSDPVPSVRKVDVGVLRACVIRMLKVVDGTDESQERATTAIQDCYATGILELSEAGRSRGVSQFIGAFGQDRLILNVQNGALSFDSMTAWIQGEDERRSAAVVALFAASVLKFFSPRTVTGLPRIATMGQRARALSGANELSARSDYRGDVRDVAVAFGYEFIDDDDGSTEELTLPSEEDTGWPTSYPEDGALPKAKEKVAYGLANALLTALVTGDYAPDTLVATREYFFQWLDTVATEEQMAALAYPKEDAGLEKLFTPYGVDKKGEWAFPAQLVDQPELPQTLSTPSEIKRYTMAISNLLLAVWLSREKLVVGKGDTASTAIRRASALMNASSQKKIADLSKAGKSGGLTKLMASLLAMSDPAEAPPGLSPDVEAYKGITLIATMMCADQIEKTTYGQFVALYRRNIGTIAKDASIAPLFSTSAIRETAKIPSRLAIAAQVLYAIDTGRAPKVHHLDELRNPGGAASSALDDIAAWE